MAYIGKSPSGTGVRQRYYFTATGGETTLGASADDNGLTLSYSDGAYVDVLLNGIELVAGTDYNTNTANRISGLAALAASDVVTVTVYDIFTVADTVSAKDGGTFSGNVVFNGNTTGLDLNGTEMVLDADGDTSITADTDDQIDFKTGGSDRVTIDSSGNVGIGTTSPSSSLTVSNTTAFSTLELANSGATYSSFIGTTSSDALAIKVNNGERARLHSGQTGFQVGMATFGTAVGASNGGISMGALSDGGYLEISRESTAARNHVVFFNPNGLVGKITCTGSSTAYQTSSDYRLKENDVDMTGAITRVKQLQPKRFNFIADTTDTLVDGFMAHEVQTVVPEAISGTHNEVDADGNPVYQGIDQSKLVPLLTGALQEAIAKIEALETRVQALEDA